MDILSQLSGVKDSQLRNLLSHAMRCVLQHNMIVSNTNQALQEKKIPEAELFQTQQGLVMHAETAQILTALVNRLLVDQEEAAPTPPGATKPKRKKLPGA